MKTIPLLGLCAFFIAALVFTIHSGAQQTVSKTQQTGSSTNGILGVIFFGTGKDGRISLAEIEQRARQYLHEKYADFPKEIALGSLHIRCKGSRETFSFFYALGGVGSKYWEVRLGADFKVQDIESGKIGGR
jgi:hypothetical protein